jgi:hypothetical protein
LIPRIVATYFSEEYCNILVSGTAVKTVVLSEQKMNASVSEKWTKGISLILLSLLVLIRYIKLMSGGLHTVLSDILHGST